MMNEQTIGLMNEMRLFGMAAGFDRRLGDPKCADLSHEEVVGLLVQDEKTDRENRRLKRLLGNAKLRQQAALEDVDYRHPRGLNKQVILELSNTRWIDAHRNVILSGPSGIGKSWIACALGNFAARAGYTVFYTRASRLFGSLQRGRGDGSFEKVFSKLAKVQILIVDDFLLTVPTETERRDFLEIAEERYDVGSTVFTSQRDPKEWHKNIGDPTIADAICDRFLHNAYKIALRGESIRKTEAKKKRSPR